MSDSDLLDLLREQYGIPDAVEFGVGPNRLLRITVTTPQAEAVLHLHGAHLTHYRPHGQPPVLFLSRRSRFEPGAPIRGGIPIVFPWFGPNAADPAAPMHGFARVAEWRMESALQGADGAVALALRLDSFAATHPAWPHAYVLRFRVVIGAVLELCLEAENVAEEPVRFEEALHTYLAVGDARRVSVTGLAGAGFIDKTDGMRRKSQQPEALRLAGETDRVYTGMRAACVVDDPVWGRRLLVEKTGSETTVVWNPWIEKARALPDLADDEWREMLCIESGNAADNAISLPPGGRHEMRVTIRSLPR